MAEFAHPMSMMQHFAIAMGEPEYGHMTWMPTVPVHGSRYVQLGTGYKYIKGFDNLEYEDWDANGPEPMPYEDDSVDGIAVYHTLDHIANPTFTIAECQRVLKPNGWLVVITPHYASELWNSDVTHASRWATESWRNMFSQRQYKHTTVPGHPDEWKLEIVFNMILGLTERNTVLVTQLVKR